MTNIRTNNGNIEIIGEKFDMKMDVNRKIYVRNKKFNDNYQFINSRIVPGLSRREKEQYMYILYNQVAQKYEDELESQDDYKKGEIKDEQFKKEEDYE